METRKASKASVYFRHDSWNHRYAKIHDNGQKEYGSITGFETEEEATESFWKYLNDYRKKLEDLTLNAETLQQSYYDEEDEIIFLDEEDDLYEERSDDEE